MKYDYQKAIKCDIKKYIVAKCYKISNSDNLKERLESIGELYKQLYKCDSITGYYSGTYTKDSDKAKEYVIGNLDILKELIEDDSISYQEIGVNIINNNWELLDCTIRKYILEYAFVDLLDEIDKHQKEKKEAKQ